jgi:hypothetical protein
LHIALHDGFTGHTVTVTVDGREVYRRAGVRTDLRISRADAFDTDAPGPAAKIEVRVDPGSLQAAIRLDLAATPYLAINLINGAIQFTPSATPFFYM